MMVNQGERCPSTVKLGEGPLVVHCERNAGHHGKHREYGESVDENSGKNVSVIIEWLEQVDHSAVEHGENCSCYNCVFPSSELASKGKSSELKDIISERDWYCAELAKRIDEINQLKKWQGDVQERESVTCPEDYGFDEYINVLKAALRPFARVHQEGLDRNEVVLCRSNAWILNKDIERAHRLVGEFVARECQGAGVFPPQSQRVNLIYWLLRAYQSGHREGWERGPSTDETMERICDVLANAGYDPSSSKAKELLINGYQ
jgi:hypothetical protein